jgi:hypothetical protein
MLRPGQDILRLSGDQDKIPMQSTQRGSAGEGEYCGNERAW